MTRPTDRDAPGVPLPTRRTVLLGAGAAGAGLLAARTVPLAPTEVADAAQVAADGRAGYRLSPHVLRYYETAKV